MQTTTKEPGRGAEESRRGTVDPKLLLEARNQFFPGWWMYKQLEKNPGVRPLYRVVCHSDWECDLVKQAAPTFVRTEIIPANDDTLLLAQLRHDQQERAGSVLSDGRAIDLLEALSDEGELDIEKIAGMMAGPEDWISLARLFRAGFATEVGDVISSTAAGEEQLREWQRIVESE